MTKLILLSRAVATVAAAFGACLLAFVLQGAFACSAAAFTPTSKTGGENTPLSLDTSTGPTHAASPAGASIVRTIVGLAIVIAVIWGLAWILRQVKAGRGGGDSDQSSAGLASVAALTLGSGRSVHLVRAGHDYVLLGSTEHGVAPIHRYTEDQARDAGLAIAGGAAGGSPPEHSQGRSRLVSTAGAMLAGAGRALGHNSYAGQSAFYGRDTSELHHSPRAEGWEPPADPMRMPSPSSGLIERLREMTVRR